MTLTNKVTTIYFKKKKICPIKVIFFSFSHQIVASITFAVVFLSVVVDVDFVVVVVFNVVVVFKVVLDFVVVLAFVVVLVVVDVVVRVDVVVLVDVVVVCKDGNTNLIKFIFIQFS
jgi:hypothetical protein